MHVVFTAVPGHGHVNPMVPLARAFQARGDRVTFVTGSTMHERVQQLGFPCVTAGPDVQQMQHDALADPSVRELLADQPWRVAAAIFGGRVGPVLDDLAGVDLAPDLVVHDAYELAGPLFAARSGVPWVTHAVGPRWPVHLEEHLRDVVAGAWAAHGCIAPPRGGVGHHTYLELCPPGTRSDDSVTTDPTIEIRPVPLAEAPNPKVRFESDDRPRVYATLGTFSNADAAPFRTLLDAFAGTSAEVVMTVGDHVTPRDLAPVPPNVRIERYVPQAQLLADCDLVVCHGGSGTVLAALAAAVPVIIVPQGADQFRNAPFWERSGAAVVVPIDHLDADAIGAGLAAASPGAPLHRAAASVATSIAAMPPAVEVADRLARLAG